MGYRKIIVGTDGSPTARVAQDAAIRLARRFRGGLVVVSAWDPARITKQATQAMLEFAVQSAARQKVDAVVEAHQGDPSELILDAARDHDADLIVLGNKGMGEATRFRLGSVPDRVAHFAPCDLLIVNTYGPGALDGSPITFNRILAATDGSPTATEACRKAFEVAMMFGAEVLLVYVGDPLIGAITLEETASGRPEGVVVNQTVVQGDPAEKVCELAEVAGSDLVVVGNKGMSGARRFLLGSVPNRVAHYAATNVLIARTVGRSIEDLAAGHGGVLVIDGKRVAVYRDEEDVVHAISPKCTHMGCIVDWNDSDRTWDCPCHGSRYRWDGGVIQGPAVKPLAAVDLDGRGTSIPRPEQPRSAGARRGADRYVIVGASLAGGTAAATLRREGFDGTLVLVGAEPHPPYERPPLSKAFLRGEDRFEDFLVESPSFYPDHGIETRFGSRAQRIDVSQRNVLLEGGDAIPYDRLLIATGARNRRFPIPGLDLPGVFDLRTIDDALRLKEEIGPGRRAVIAGMGFIGSEVAASLRQLDVEVTTIDGGAVPLGRVLGEQVGRVLADIHSEKGVRSVFQDRVAAFEGDGRVERVVTAGGRELTCDFAVVGLGVEPVTDLVQGSPIEVDNGILVDEACRTSVEGIYAAGDVANHRHPVFGRVRVEHWQNAIKQGRSAALSMLDRGRPYDEIHWFWSDQYEYNLQYAGYHREWDDLVVRGSLENRDFSVFYIKAGRVQAAASMGRAQDIRDAMPLIRGNAPVDPSILRDEARTLTPSG